ncbi:MAG: phosphatidate cytidylyltransferase [Prolixibacteraceae bacterium]|nr:phosphatidate cytidylyltransferase [Prolixibacteraceae bacterium]
MKELAVRTIAGAVYVLLTVGSILAGKVPFAVFFTLVIAGIMFEFYRLVKKGGYNPSFLPGILVASYLFIAQFLYAFSFVGEKLYLGLIPLLMIIPFAELFKKGGKSIMNIALTSFGIVYIALPLSLLCFIVVKGQEGGFSPLLIIGLFVVIWAFDSGAYLVGSRFGKHKMTGLSPKKSWEGFAGGIVLAIAVSLIYFDLINFSKPVFNIALAILIGISGTLGDITESLIKRNFNQKDSGSIMPGHGGLLDRFDSLLFSAPVFYAYISLVN